VRSGDVAGQAMPPELEVTCPCNTAIALSNVPRTVWAVAPSCWDQGAPVTCDVFCSTGYRAEISVAVRLPSSESEFQYFQTPTLHTQLCNSIPHTLCGCSSLQCRQFFLADLPGEVKMSLVRRNGSALGRLHSYCKWHFAVIIL